MPPQTLRIIDANRNRIGEGLRLLEDIARFLLDDASLSQQLKEMRHGLVKSLSKTGTGLLSARDAERDVGADNEITWGQQDIPSLVAANAKRVEEALRVIEEVAKLPEISQTLHPREFKQARFNLYTMEQELLAKIMRRNKVERLSGLYAILDTQVLRGRDEVEIADKAIRGGAKIIQLRDKQHSKGELLDKAQRLSELCHKCNVLFIINDHLDLAVAADADGLHIGQDDLPLTLVRRELPIDKIIGCSTTTRSQALRAQDEGADYIAVGSIFPSATKQDAPVVGIERLREIKQAIFIPLVAIGGIDKENIAEVIAAGANSAAVISAILTEENIEGAVHQLVNQIEQETESNSKSRRHC